MLLSATIQSKSIVELGYICPHATGTYGPPVMYGHSFVDYTTPFGFNLLIGITRI